MKDKAFSISLFSLIVLLVTGCVAKTETRVAQGELVSVLLCEQKISEDGFKSLLDALQGIAIIRNSVEPNKSVEYTIPNSFWLYGRQVNTFSVSALEPGVTEYRTKFVGESIETVARTAGIQGRNGTYLISRNAGKFSIEAERGATFFVCRQQNEK